MNDIKVFKNIKTDYDRNLIMTRLGYKRGTTELGEDYKKELTNLIQKSESLCNITAAYRYIDIKSNTDGKIMLEDGTILKGKELSKLLSASERAVLMVSTAGKSITDRIAGLMENGNASEAVIMDAAASEIADSGLDFVMNYINTMLRKEGMTLTKMRFSPGYGDFVIEQQRDFARLLTIDKFGISLTESCMLIPEKTVLAIAGIVPINLNGA